ncbi:MAG: hypothetical protein ABH871_09750 [Pseudomonadota bacterium]
MTKKEQTGLDVHAYDTRLLERNLRDGKITKKEYDAYLKKLTDTAANAEYIEVEDESTIEADATNASSDDLTFT